MVGSFSADEEEVKDEDQWSLKKISDHFRPWVARYGTVPYFLTEALVSWCIVFYSDSYLQCLTVTCVLHWLVSPGDLSVAVTRVLWWLVCCSDSCHFVCCIDLCHLVSRVQVVTWVYVTCAQAVTGKSDTLNPSELSFIFSSLDIIYSLNWWEGDKSEHQWRQQSTARVCVCERWCVCVCLCLCYVVHES